MIRKRNTSQEIFNKKAWKKDANILKENLTIFPNTITEVLPNDLICKANLYNQ